MTTTRSFLVLNCIQNIKALIDFIDFSFCSFCVKLQFLSVGLTMSAKWLKLDTISLWKRRWPESISKPVYTKNEDPIMPISCGKHTKIPTLLWYNARKLKIETIDLTEFNCHQHLDGGYQRVQCNPESIAIDTDMDFVYFVSGDCVYRLNLVKEETHSINIDFENKHGAKYIYSVVFIDNKLHIFGTSGYFNNGTPKNILFMIQKLAKVNVKI